jgi:hypothetical protein
MRVRSTPKGSRPVDFGEFLAFVFGYIVLLVERGEAEDRGLDPSACPVPLSCLRKVGVEDPVLLWMMYQGHVEHFQPVAGPDNERESWIPTVSLIVLPTSAFTLTKAGAVVVERFLADLLAPEHEVRAAARGELWLGRLVPCYDPQDRIFSWGPHVLKHFRQPAVNQELVLCAAEELAWPEWFDDPLPRVPGCNPKVRLHDTTKDLNRRQTPYLVHFRGDGSGTRVGWVYR